VKMIDSSLQAIKNYRYVDAGLSTSGQPSADQLRAIAQAGFTVVINLALHDDPRYSLVDEPGTVRALGMDYVHIPVQFDAPTQNDLIAFFDAMKVHAERKLWLHCAANIRVSAFLGLYRIIVLGWEREKAFELMHGLWEPNETWASFIGAMPGVEAQRMP
jgi:protein tyrosine phosphatase (PTP) superfamily phosphohydrolase (DUF442 family)